MTAPTLIYGSLDGEPFVLAETPGRIEAWMVREGSDSWVEVGPAEPAHEGRMLSKAAFDAKFPSLPPLPGEIIDAPPLAPAE